MNIAIIGGGNLGTALALGLKTQFPEWVITLTRRNTEKIEHLRSKGITISDANTEAIAPADMVILAVKPHQILGILDEIRGTVKKKPLVSVVTGVSLSEIEARLEPGAVVFRVMPNTAVARGASMTCIAAGKAGNEAAMKQVETVFKAVGDTVVIDEKMMDAATVLGACGIAFALRYIRAAMQGGIQIGFDAPTSLKIVTQTVKGAAALLSDNLSHPEGEIDKVTTPKGCTIAGLNEMEQKGFSAALIRGILTSFEEIDQLK